MFAGSDWPSQLLISTIFVIELDLTPEFGARLRKVCDVTAGDLSYLRIAGGNQT